MKTLHFGSLGFVLFLLFALGLPTLASAATIYVKTSGNDAGLGNSWASAKKTVQAAVNAASEGDEIWVAAGTYAEHVKNKTAGPSGSEVAVNVALYAGFAGTETNRDQRNWQTNLTILDGGGGGEPTVDGSVIIIDSSATEATRIDGFVITGGHAFAAGGISIGGSGPVIANNTIIQNLGGVGGGILITNYKITPPQVHPTITGNTIMYNYGSETGGGIVVVGSERLVSYDPVAPLITGNYISRNGSALHGGGIGIFGHAAPRVTNNVILGNVAAYDEANFMGNGGGIYATSRDVDDAPLKFAVCAPVIVSNLIAANGANFGGGIHLWDTDAEHGGIPVVTNNTVVGNNGTGITWMTTYPVLQNNLVAYNSRGLEQGDAQSPPTALRNNCVYGNELWEKDTNYNGLADQTGIDGNISTDPLMANYRAGNFHLQTGSPCIDAGYSAAIGSGWTDIDGQARIIGSGVDIGADESDGTVSAAPTPIYYVKTSGNDAQNGLSWATAKKTLAAAIGAAQYTGGEIWVASGTYAERNILPAFLYLYGGFAGTETTRDQRSISANPTILDGGGGQPTVINSLYAGYFLSAIDGFTIQNGGLYTGGSIPTGSQGYYGRGAGIYCQVTSPLIQNNTIRHNSLGNPFDSANKTGYGGGIYAYLSYAIIRGNTITENEIINTLDGEGGGIYFFRSMPTISGNTITNNRAKFGAAIYGLNSNPRIVGNIIENNSFYNLQPLYMGAAQGAVVLNLCWDFLIEGNRIKGNLANATGGAGAGINASTNFAGRIVNNLILDNIANGMGGGIYGLAPTAATASLYIVNNTIVGNTANSYSIEGGGGVAISIPPAITTPPDPIPNRVIMANNILAFNSSGIFETLTSPMVYPTLVKNDVYNTSNNYIYLPAGATDIHVDPGLVNRTGGNFRLSPSSPCIDAGDNASLPAGVTRDYELKARTQGGSHEGNPVVDMGAYEFVFPNILWRNSSTGEILLWFMKGTARIDSASLGSVSLNSRIVGLADFNGDSKPDILWRNVSTGENYVWYMDGVTCIGIGSLPTVADQNWKLVGVGDFNNDDNPDILWRNEAAGDNYVWYMDGVTLIRGGSLPAVADQNWKVVAVADFNNDDKPDVLWRNISTGENYVWYLNGLTIQGSGNLPMMADQTWKVVGVGDYNGDGWVDILWRNSVTQQNYVWYVSEMTLVGADTLEAMPNADWLMFDRGETNRSTSGSDFDGDGQTDLVWRNTSTGEMSLWLMDGVNRKGAAIPLGTVDPLWKLAGLADFSGDGKVDILWRNGATGENYVWYMDGVTILGGGNLPTVADQNWKVVGVGDFNKDDKPDILWRNISTGDNYVWYLDGVTVLGGASLQTVPDQNWTIMPQIY
jgi:hypothetical protein